MNAELLEKAAAVSQALADLFKRSADFWDSWQRHASPDAQEKLTQVKRDLQFGVLGVAAAETDAEKETSLKNVFNAMIRRTEIMAGAVAAGKPGFAAELEAFFSNLKSDPVYGPFDYGQAFEEAGAPTLAAAARKATVPKP